MSERRCSHGFMGSVVPCPNGCHQALPKHKGRAPVWTDDEITAALKRAPSIKHAAEAIGTSPGVIYKRAEHSPAIRALLEKVRAPVPSPSGKNGSGRYRHPAWINMAGMVCGTWTVLHETGTINGNARWLCRHECGAESALEGIVLRSDPPEFCRACRPKRPGTVRRLRGAL